jgi:DNA polymerase-3 subunit epsilon
MNLILPFDTETTGIPVWGVPSESEEQPHLVSLAAILCDGETGEVKEDLNVIIKPDGWVIPAETIEIHGITNEQAMDEGISEIEALERFMGLIAKSGLRVAHNTTFDNRMIRIALKRYLPDLIPDDVWKDKSKYFCTLLKSKKIMGGKSGHTLAEAYLHFTGKVLENAHNAMADTQACKEIYFAIKNQPSQEA